MLIGEHGSIFKNYGRGKPVVLPEANFSADKYPINFELRDHYHDWVDAILQGRKACDEFSHGGPLTEAVLVGAMAAQMVKEMLALVDDPGRGPTRMVLDTELVLRDSA